MGALQFCPDLSSQAQESGWIDIFTPDILRCHNRRSKYIINSIYNHSISSKVLVLGHWHNLS